MRLVQWIDERGRKRQAYVRDNDPDDMAPKSGIRHEPPDVERLDWERFKTDLHNALIDGGLLSWKDVQAQQNSLLPLLSRHLRRQLIALYREKV